MWAVNTDYYFKEKKLVSIQKEKTDKKEKSVREKAGKDKLVKVEKKKGSGKKYFSGEYKGTITISIEEELRNALLVVAEDMDRSLSSLCRVVFKEWLETKGFDY